MPPPLPQAASRKDKASLDLIGGLGAGSVVPLNKGQDGGHAEHRCSPQGVVENNSSAEMSNDGVRTLGKW